MSYNLSKLNFDNTEADHSTLRDVIVTAGTALSLMVPGNQTSQLGVLEFDLLGRSYILTL